MGAIPIPEQAYVLLTFFDGWGSTATAIPYFQDVEDRGGTYLTVLNDSTDGARIQVDRDGIYLLHSHQIYSTSIANPYGVITKNAPDPTIVGSTVSANPEAIPGCMCGGSGGAGDNFMTSNGEMPVELAAGDVLRLHGQGSGHNFERYWTFSARLLEALA